MFQRSLPPGYSLNGPLALLRGGITTTHELHPNDGDQVLLYNPDSEDFDTYFFLFGEWISAEDFSATEPVIGPGDAFFYLNTGTVPLIWQRSFIIQ
jgi:hypothetical protein